MADRSIPRPAEEKMTAVERYFTRPAIDRRLPDESRDARTALSIVQSEMLLDGDPAKNLKPLRPDAPYRGHGY